MRARHWPWVTAGVGTVVALLALVVPRLSAYSPDPVDGPLAGPESEAPRGPADTAPRTTGGRDEEGARRAALTYATASQDWLYLDDAAVAEAVAAISTPEAAVRLAEEVVAQVAVAREALAASPGRVWWLVRPLAWQVQSYQADGARVAVWILTVLSAADVAVPQADWITVTLDLEWRKGRWLVADVVDTPGPTPTLGTRDRPWSPERFDDTLEGFTRMGSAPAS